MKYFLVTVLSFLFLVSCEKVDDDSDLVCTSNCTSVSGIVYTQNNIRLKNSILKFRYQEHIGTGGLYSRILSREKTNSMGEYSMSFFIKDEELGSSFDLYPEKNSISDKVFYPEYYNLFTTLNVENRGLNVQRNLYIPTAKKVKIELNNFSLISNEDYFSFEVVLPCGFDLEDVNPETGNNHRYANTGINKYILNQYTNMPSKVFEINLALNEINFINIIRNKNGSYTRETFPVFIDSNSNEVLQYTY